MGSPMLVAEKAAKGAAASTHSPAPGVTPGADKRRPERIPLQGIHVTISHVKRATQIYGYAILASRVANPTRRNILLKPLRNLVGLLLRGIVMVVLTKKSTKVFSGRLMNQTIRVPNQFILIRR